MKTFCEWLTDEYNEEGIVCSTGDVVEEILDIAETLINGHHYGDCTKQNVTCKVCLFQNQLDDYFQYVKNFKGQ